jgi:hypothetical protein
MRGARLFAARRTLLPAERNRGSPAEGLPDGVSLPGRRETSGDSKLAIQQGIREADTYYQVVADSET